MTGSIISTALGIAVLILYIREKIRGASVKALYLKTLDSLLFIAAGICASAEKSGEGIYCLHILGGLVLGLIGDILLDMKYVYPQDERIHTYGGFTAFSLGHICYLSAMLLNNALPMGWIIGAAAVAVIAGILVGTVGGKIMELNYGEYQTITIIYGALLTATSIFALCECIATSFTMPVYIVMLTGGILFLASDLVLAGTYFGNKNRPIDTILNYLTYYPAQFIIALSILALR